MIENIILNSFNWEFLQWDQINEKIFILQKKIYKASQKCDYKQTNIYQKYLLDCHEIKIIAIEQICKSIASYYVNHNSKQYTITNEDKVNLLQALLKKDYILSINMKYIFAKVQQYIIYLSLQPEWTARFEPIFHSSINRANICYIYQKLIAFFKDRLKFKANQKYGYYFNFCIANKYIDTHYIVKKLGFSCNINIGINIQNWLDNQYDLKPFNNYYNEHNNWIFDYSNQLYLLIQKVLLNGIEWYHINTIQTNLFIYNLLKHNRLFYDNNNWIEVNYGQDNINVIHSLSIIFKALQLNSYSINKYPIISNNRRIIFVNHYIEKNKYSNILYDSDQQLIIKIQPNIFKFFLQRIKSILYHKNTYNQLKLNTHLFYQKCLKKIRYEFKVWYLYYSQVLSIKHIKKYCKILDYTIYIWLKKLSNFAGIIFLRKHKKFFVNQINQYADIFNKFTEITNNRWEPYEVKISSTVLYERFL